MKHLKITTALLSALMCASMVMTPVPVIADETEATETQKIEETEKEEASVVFPVTLVKLASNTVAGAKILKMS